MRIILATIFLCLVAKIGTSQEVWGDSTDGPELLQFSGVVVSGDSLVPVAFANCYDKTTMWGVMADIYGYFTFVVEVGDTVVFSAVGYKKAQYIIPQDLESVPSPFVQMLEADTIVLDEAFVYPWPTKDQFADAFVNLEIPDDDLQRAYANLTPQAMAQLAENLSMDGSQNFKWSMTQKSAELYFKGQAQPMNIFNPIAWAQFIQAWKNGDFKKDDDY